MTKKLIAFLIFGILIAQGGKIVTQTYSQVTRELGKQGVHLPTKADPFGIERGIKDLERMAR